MSSFQKPALLVNRSSDSWICSVSYLQAHVFQESNLDFCKYRGYPSLEEVDFQVDSTEGFSHLARDFYSVYYRTSKYHSQLACTRHKLRIPVHCHYSCSDRPSTSK